MKSLKSLLPYLRRHFSFLVIAALLALPLSAIRLGPAPLVKYWVDDFMATKDSSKLTLFPFAVIGIYILNFIIRFFHYYLLRIVIARVNQRLKNDLYQHFLGLSADYFTTRSTGQIISRVSMDPQHVDGALSCINVLIREPITLIFLFGYALHLHWKLTLLTLVIIPFLAWIFANTGKHLKRYVTRMQEESAGLVSALQETFAGFRVIKVFRLEGFIGKKFFDRSESFTKFLLKTAKLEEASHPLVELVTAFAVAILFSYGGSLILKNELTPGELLAFFATFAMMMNPIRLLNDVNIKMNTASAAMVRINDAFSWKSRIQEITSPVPVLELKEGIEFRDVRFHYPDDPSREILKGLSFSLQKGRTIALVGPSGSGKTSTAGLLPRLFDVTQGAILWDGVPLTELKLGDLRDRIAIVSQDVFLFNDTIEENLRGGRVDATREEIVEAARKAHALEFIQRMPEGWNTIIGDRGQKLSGGERQRLSIARAFLREAPLLILDEATSNLDTASERIVQESLEDLMKDRTTLVIAHRLSTIRDADEILVLQDGQILERGTHDTLLGNQGAYFQLHKLGDVLS